MPRILVEVLPGGGSMAGRQMVLDQSPVRFGRDLSNTVALEPPAVSRFHGELVHTPDGVWTVVGLSGNGTKAGRKKVGEQPIALAGDKPTVLSLAGKPLLRVTPLPDAIGAADSPETQAADAQAIAQSQAESQAMAGTGGKKRMGVWVGIGAWLVFLAGLAVALASTAGPDEKVDTLPTRLTAEQIRAELQTPPRFIAQDSTLAERHLRQANEHFNTIGRKRDALAQAHSGYYRALQYTPGRVFDSGLDQRRFQYVQRQLSDDLVRTYDRAYDWLEGQDYERAERALNDLRRSYAGDDLDESTSGLLRNVARLRSYCMAQLDQ